MFNSTETKMNTAYAGTCSCAPTVSFCPKFNSAHFAMTVCVDTVGTTVSIFVFVLISIIVINLINLVSLISLISLIGLISLVLIKNHSIMLKEPYRSYC